LIEELLNSEENTIPTHHPKIMIAKVREYNWKNISAQTDQLVGLFDSQNNNNIVQTMKEMVPEYISSNSEYEVLDMKN
jgi:FlaA1/EpsC-like NDP-sugar epimerase